MKKDKADVIARAIYLLADGEFILTYADKATGIPHVAGLHCEIDTVPHPVVYLANRKKDGGQWAVGLAFKDNAGTVKNITQLRQYRYIDEERRKLKFDIYRMMNVARAWVNVAERTVLLRFNTTDGMTGGEFHLALTSYDDRIGQEWQMTHLAVERICILTN